MRRAIKLTMKRETNYITLLVFAPVLVLTGLLGFILPEGPMSNAAAYNIFHILFGLIGICLLLFENEALIRTFNIGFGAIDLYQAVASFMNWFPEAYFQWKPADDVLHVVIGAALVAIGLTGRRKSN